MGSINKWSNGGEKKSWSVLTYSNGESGGRRYPLVQWWKRGDVQVKEAGVLMVLR